LKARPVCSDSTWALVTSCCRPGAADMADGLCLVLQLFIMASTAGRSLQRLDGLSHQHAMRQDSDCTKCYIEARLMTYVFEM
jgi:hypothetical protein